MEQTLQNSKKIILFNGPPESGKDTCANLIESVYGAHHVRFKDGLINIVLRMFNLTREWWDERYTRQSKEVPRPELMGYSQRQILIHVSEHVLKPVLGEDVFGRIAAHTISKSDKNLFVFSDSGFVEELLPVVECVGAHNVSIVQLHRNGCSFEGDSRSYLPENVFGCNFVQLNNNSDDLAILFNRIDTIVHQIVA